MNTLNSLISAEWTQALGWTLVHSLWQGAIIAILVAVAMIFLQKFSARLRYMIYCMSLLLLVGSSIVTFIKVYEKPRATVVYSGEQAVSEEKPVLVILADALLRQHTASGIEESWNKFTGYIQRNMPMLVMVWFAGMLVFLLRFFGSLAYTQRLHYYKVYPADDKWRLLVSGLTKKIGIERHVRLMQSAAIEVPVALGYFRPLILVPVGFFMQMPADQIEAVLMHELAHIRRKDYLFNLIQSFLEAVFFYHPAVWWISGNIRIEREHISDDIALAYCNDPILYANALASVQEMKLRKSVLAPAITRNKNSLLNRIQRMMKRPRLIPNYAEGFISAIIILITIAAISATAAITFKADEALLNMMDFKTEDPVLKGMAAVDPVYSAENINTPSRGSIIPVENIVKEDEDETISITATFGFPDTIDKRRDSLADLHRQRVEQTREYMEQAELARQEYQEKLREARKQQHELQTQLREELEKALQENRENYKMAIKDYQRSLRDIYPDSNMKKIVITDGESGNVMIYSSDSPFWFDAKIGDDKEYSFEYKIDIDEDSSAKLIKYWVPGEMVVPGAERNVIVVDEMDSLFHHDIDVVVEPGELFGDVYVRRHIEDENERLRAHSERLRDHMKDVQLENMNRVMPDYRIKGYAYTSKLNRIVKDELRSDGLIERNGDYIITLDDRKMFINGVKQSRSVYKKYRNLIESFNGEEIRGGYEFKMVL